jgi:hypothetical protein
MVRLPACEAGSVPELRKLNAEKRRLPGVAFLRSEQPRTPRNTRPGAGEPVFGLPLQELLDVPRAQTQQVQNAIETALGEARVGRRPQLGLGMKGDT